MGRPVKLPIPGSSPLARGLHYAVWTPGTHVRIIPARAGFTKMRYVCPRARVGSSPLARGLLFDEFIIEKGSRIIPARAGFT